MSHIITAGTDVAARVRAIIEEVSRRDAGTIADDDDLVEALGVDSLQGLQILAGVEKRFEIRIPDGELIQLRSIRRIVATVERVQRSQEGGS
jgi:acyl carrier protein